MFKDSNLSLKPLSNVTGRGGVTEYKTRQDVLYRYIVQALSIHLNVVTLTVHLRQWIDMYIKPGKNDVQLFLGFELHVRYFKS